MEDQDREEGEEGEEEEEQEGVSVVTEIHFRLRISLPPAVVVVVRSVGALTLPPGQSGVVQAPSLSTPSAFPVAPRVPPPSPSHPPRGRPACHPMRSVVRTQQQQQTQKPKTKKNNHLFCPHFSHLHISVLHIINVFAPSFFLSFTSLYPSLSYILLLLLPSVPTHLISGVSTASGLSVVGRTEELLMIEETYHTVLEQVRERCAVGVSFNSIYCIPSSPYPSHIYIHPVFVCFGCTV